MARGREADRSGLRASEDEIADRSSRVRTSDAGGVGEAHLAGDLIGHVLEARFAERAG